MAGLALTPLALQSIRPGLRIVDKKDRMPKLPEVEFVLLVREKDTRPAVSALAGVILQMAAAAVSPNPVKRKTSAMTRRLKTASASGSNSG
jgi:hypothetical protein